MDIYKMLDRNRGVLGVEDVAEALDLDPDELAAWADDSDVACVDGVLVFQRQDVGLLLVDLADDEDDEDDEGDEDLTADDDEGADEPAWENSELVEDDDGQLPDEE